MVFGIFLVCAYTGNVGADTLLIESVKQAEGIPRPVHGTTMGQVLTQFGEPLKRSAAIGQPPITQWKYASFIVYFEYRKVLHAVVPHKMASN